MRILISNDDGYQAPGVVALYEALKEIADVEVVAPEQNNSAKSNALTLHSPLYVHRAVNGFRYVNGTPADCVHIALTGLLDYRPDLVVSGINNGANMGDDTVYSGTVGAAMEGYLFGIPSIAFSQVQRDWLHLDAAAHKARELVLQMSQQNLLGSGGDPGAGALCGQYGRPAADLDTSVCPGADGHWPGGRPAERVVGGRGWLCDCAGPDAVHRLDRA